MRTPVLRSLPALAFVVTCSSCSSDDPAAPADTAPAGDSAAETSTPSDGTLPTETVEAPDDTAATPGDTSPSDDGAVASEAHEHGTGELAAHIHGLAFWRGSKEIVLGTHEGTWRTEAGHSALVQLAPAGDFMGLIGDPLNPDRLWSSGHYPSGGFPNWGWIESLDGGTTWTNITLGGSVDFHLTAASRDTADVVAGLYDGQIHYSTDAGRTWVKFAWTEPARALQIASASGPVFLIASGSGIARVTAPAMTTSPLRSADVTALAFWGDGFVYGSGEGKVFLCDADLAQCSERPGPRGQAVVRFLVDPDDRERIYALDAGSGVFHSDDGATSWAPIVGGH